MTELYIYNDRVANLSFIDLEARPDVPLSG